MEKIWLKHYQKGVPHEINSKIYSSLLDILETSVKKFAQKPAFTNLGTHISFAELDALSLQFATYLQQTLGLKKGDRIAIMLPNVLQYPVVLFGALKAGLIVVNVNPLYKCRELTHQVNDAQAQTIVVLANFAQVLQEALPKTGLKNIIVTELGDLFPQPKAWLVNFVVKHIKKLVPAWSIPQSISFKKVLAQGKNKTFQPVILQGEDIAFLQYTGGTTGIAKGAVLTHSNMVANVQQIVAWMQATLVESGEIVITALPLYHIFSLTVNCLAFMCFGAQSILITNPRDISGLVAELKKIPFTAVIGVNTLFNALLNNAEFVKLNFSSLKVALGGGAAIQHAVAQRWQDVTGKILLEGYGLTEASPVVSAMPLDIPAYNGSIGLPLPSTDISLRDEQGQEVPLGEKGELCVNGPQVMREYWHHPEETQMVLKDGWLSTGDIAQMDEEGYLYLVDRKKDMILVSGFNVYPNEIEDVIAEHPGVLEVAVIGVQSDSTGEAIKAFIVPKDPTLTPEALLAYCRENLTGYKIPKFIEFRDSLPKSPVGKVLRRELK